MTVREVPMYKVVCDYPGCPVDTAALNPDGITAWGTIDQAVENWLGNDGVTASNGYHFCYDHRNEADR